MKNKNYLKEELYELIKNDESIFDFIQESCLDGLWYWDLEQPEEEWMNPKFWSVLGYDHREMPHKASAWQDIIHPEDLKLATENFTKHCENPAHPYDQTVRYTHKNGSTVWIRCRGLAIRDKHGKPLRMLGAHQEISDFKNNELLLQKNTALLRNAQQIAKIGSWELDLKTNEVVWTEELYKMYGLDATLPPPPFSEQIKLYSPESWEALTASVDLAIAQGTPYELELKTIRKNGSHKWIWARGEAVFDENKTTIGIRGVAQDITERKKAEEEIKRTALLLETAQQEAKIGTWELDLATGKTFWTDEVYSIHEVEKDFDHNRENSIEFYDPDYRPIISQAITDSIEQQIPFDVKCKFITAKNNQLWVRSSGYPVIKEGKVTRLIGMFKDITQEEADKEAFVKEQMFSKQLIENMADGFGAIDAEGKLILVNKAFCEMTGFSENELIGQTAPYPYWPSEELENIREAFQQTLAGDLSTFENTLQKKNGRRFPVQLSTSALKDEEGNTVNYFANIKDITDRKKAELELTKAKDFLQQTSQVAQVGGWDFNNLTGEISWSDVICDINEVPHGFVPTYEQMSSSYTPESWVQLEKAIHNALTDGTPYDLEAQITTAKGKLRWVRAIGNSEFKDGKCVRLFGVLQDINDRKKAELVLQDSELRLSLATQAGGVGVWDWDIVKNILTWDDQMFALYGIKREDFSNEYEAWVNGVYEADRERQDKEAELAIKGEKEFNTEFRVQHPNGDIRNIRALGTVVRDQDGNAIRIVGTNWDITEQKEAQNEIEVSNARLSIAKEAAKIGIWEFFIDDQKLIWDDKMFDLFNVSKSTFSGTYEAWRSTVHPDDLERSEQELQNAIASGQSFNSEFRIVWQDKSIHHIRGMAESVLDQNGKPYKMIGVNYDITEQKEAQNEIERSNARLNLATQSAHIGIWELIIEEDILIWEDETLKLFGLTRDSFSGNYEGWKSTVHPEDVDEAEQKIREAIANKTVLNIEFRTIWPDKTIRYIGAFGKTILDDTGKVIKFVGTNYDVTERVQREIELTQAKEQAEKANKAKSEFLANLSHEIRTPLNGVIGFTELLTKTPLSPVQQQYADSANVSGHTLLGIINNILDFSKIEAGMLELEAVKTDMVALLENSIDIVKFSAADKELELLLDIDPDMPRFAHIDAIRTKQILVNLLSNAVKFTQKGEVALKAVYQALDDKQGKLSISVRDTGIGITEEQKAKLFKSFSQADSSTTRKYGGTGLGLVISQMIAEKMGSTINVDSTPDVSTTFHFDIITHFEEGEKPDTTQITGVKRCLIIDDNDSNRLILEQMLKQWHIESDSCNSGLEIIKKLENSQPYDVIICDYDMPYLNGIDTIRLMKDKLKLSTEKQPIILLHSSLDDTELNQKSKALGIRFRLNKPVKSQDLFNYLSHLNQTTETISQKETEQTANASPTSQKIKILIAEDNPLNMVLSKTIISQLMPNSEVYEARNGLEAIEHYKSISPDLIFMDVQMPELDGLETTKKIRALEVNKSNRLPIVALTAGALKEEKEKCLAAGMDDFFTKPLESTKIQTVLSKYFSQGKKVNANLQNIDAKNEIHFGFSDLARGIGNDMEMVQKFISMFITDIPSKIDQLEQACNEIDLANIKAISHSIKGSSNSMHCSVLADVAGKMENAVIDNSIENLEVLLTELKEEWETVKHLLLQKIDH